MIVVVKRNRVFKIMKNKYFYCDFLIHLRSKRVNSIVSQVTETVIVVSGNKKSLINTSCITKKRNVQESRRW